MPLNTVPVSCKSHRRKIHTLELENRFPLDSETFMDHFWEFQERVLHSLCSVCPIRFLISHRTVSVLCVTQECFSGSERTQNTFLRRGF